MAVVRACICISLVMSFALTSGSSDHEKCGNNPSNVCCKLSITDFEIPKKHLSHDDCCCDEDGKNCTSYHRAQQICDRTSGKLQPLLKKCEGSSFSPLLHVCCKNPITSFAISKTHLSHDDCCCDEDGKNCTSYDRAQQICDRTSGKLQPLLEKKCEGSSFSRLLQVCCKNPITSFAISKTHLSHDDCCCNGEGRDCSSYSRAEHVCDHQSGKLSVPKTRICRNPPLTRRSSRYSCCGDDSVYLPGVMSCDQSSGEITLKQGSTFQSSKLCRKKLHPGFDDGPAPTLRNKGLYVEGRVEKVRVDIGANYIIIDLLPARLNSTYESRTCLDQSQGRLQVMVRLPPKQWCKPLDEVQDYLYGKTLDIWADFMCVRNCRSKLPALVVPSESKSHWVMVSRRPFYLKL